MRSASLAVRCCAALVRACLHRVPQAQLNSDCSDSPSGAPRERRSRDLPCSRQAVGSLPKVMPPTPICFAPSMSCQAGWGGAVPKHTRIQVSSGCRAWADPRASRSSCPDRCPYSTTLDAFEAASGVSSPCPVYMHTASHARIHFAPYASQNPHAGVQAKSAERNDIGEHMGRHVVQQHVELY